uniref:FUN14 family n=1 Tax=Trypanosoma congolense (strain IL3000) TaxID=1068625 RepID=G0UNZ6_TRYCI|nr:conserved hypothetical protein [Trypanosoma congolense IL3000]
MSVRSKREDNNSPERKEKGEDDFIHKLPAFYPRISKEIGMSSILGAAVGVTSKRLTSDALYGTGLAIIILQFLNFFGYIQVNWKKMESDAVKVIDKDDDCLKRVDVNTFFQRFICFVGKGVGDISGFMAGFYVGARYLA